MQASVPLTVNGKTTIIPLGSHIVPNTSGLHSLPRYWGEDSLEWKPTRWIISPQLSKDSHESAVSREEFWIPPKGSFFAWSDGMRPCPGRKFSQIEFVAAMVSMFQKHRVEVVPKGNETAKEARARVMECVNDTVIVLLLQMRDPQSVGLKWVEVSS